jgi:Uma2 family endonuclease
MHSTRLQEVIMLDQTTEKLMTLDEFIRAYDREPFELISGYKQILPPHLPFHQLTVQELFRLLYSHSQAQDSGEVFFHMNCAEVDEAGCVKGAYTPDLLFVTATNWQEYVISVENWRNKPFLFVPDFVCEVVSEDDLYSDFTGKIDTYQAQGIRLIWIFDPQRKRVEVYADEHYEKLTPADVLKGGDVFPGLEIPLSEVFK